jgi:dolichyl-phosphate beta-glucosyltransferase
LLFTLFQNSIIYCNQIFFQLAIFLRASTTPYPQIKRHKEEEFFKDASGQKHKFPSIEDEPTKKLSVIIPAYEEEKRLPTMLDECMEYLETRSKEDSKFTYEVIVVSDGSKDKTVQVAMKYCEKYTTDKFRILDLIENRGKGGAVRMGMLSGRGRYLLFADADGATKFSDLSKLDESIQKLSNSDWQTDAISIGSRSHLEEESIASRSLFRTILMHGFHFLVWLFAVRTIKDTQCGFKLMTRSTARRVFKIMHVERW